MNDTTKKVLLILGSIAILAAAYFLWVSPQWKEKESIERETTTLKATLQELQEKEIHRGEYLQWTEDNQELFDAKLAEFPSNWNQEYMLMFIQAVRDNEEITYDVKNQGMTEPTLFYTLGGSNAEGQLTEQPAEGAEDAQAAEGTENAQAAAPQENYTCYSSTMTLEYQGDYAGVKDFVNHVAAYKYRMTVDAVSIALDEETNDLKGSMTVNLFSINGNGREENVDLDLNDIPVGVDNLFEGGDGAATTSKYSSDNGETIKNDYDLYMAVNPTSSDTSGKVVGLASGGNNVTSSKNESESVTVRVSKEGDQYVVEYGIGTDTRRQEFDPGDDLTMLIQSSDIKDTEDINGVAVTLENTTDKTLYVKVADDASANRVKIANRAGSVIVYK